MEEAADLRYWCHMCSRQVTPTIGEDIQLKCPLCDSGFLEEMDAQDAHPFDDDLRSDRSLSLWAPILMGMMDGRGRLARRRALAFTRGGSDGEHDFDALLMRRRSRDPASMLQLLESLRHGIALGSDDHDAAPRFGDAEREGDGDHVMFRGTTLLLEGNFIDSDQPEQTSLTASSLGDYFIGQGLDLLLQHLSDNDPNRYGTPPAQKEAVEAMPNVRINEVLQCSVCLDDLDIGSEGKEMPCKHIFHSHCILPWLDLHSSCPVCRFQIPSLQSSEQNGGTSHVSQNIGFLDNDESNSDAGGTSRRGENERESGSGRRFSWPFNGLSGSSQTGGTSSDGASPPS